MSPPEGPGGEGSPWAPRAGRESVEQLERRALREWKRRLQGEETEPGASAALVHALLACCLDPADTEARAAAEGALEREQERVRSSGCGAERVRGHFAQLSHAFWHAALTSELPLEDAVSLRDRLDAQLPGGDESLATPLFSPGTRPAEGERAPGSEAPGS